MHTVSGYALQTLVSPQGRMALLPVHPASSSSPSARISHGRQVAVVLEVEVTVEVEVALVVMVSVVVTWWQKLHVSSHQPA
jgi:hypothetical protein